MQHATRPQSHNDILLIFAFKLWDERISAKIEKQISIADSQAKSILLSPQSIQ